MILVFNFFKFIGIFITVIIGMITVFAMLIAISKAEINIKRFHISKNEENKKILIKVSLRIGKFHWLWINLDKRRLAKIYEKIKEQEDKNKQLKKKINREIKKYLILVIENKKLRIELKKIKIELKRFEADIRISTKNYIVTSYLVAIISIVISNILPHLVNEKQTRKNKEIIKNINYRINPIYINQNYYNIRLSTIINISIFKILIFLITLIKYNIKNKNYEKNKINNYEPNNFKINNKNYEENKMNKLNVDSPNNKNRKETKKISKTV